MLSANQIVRFFDFIELECGRGSELNPRLVSCVTVIRRYDPYVNEYRPYVVPSIQILDPFNEISFHTDNLNSSRHIIAASPLQLPSTRAK